MHSQRQNRLEDLFYKALDHPSSRRRQFIEDACGSDLELKSELESLISADQSAVQFLDETPFDGTQRQKNTDDNSRIGERLADYRLVRRIGVGGMGTVYEALQHNPQRTVALKILNTGLTGTKALRRFEYESQILGRLRHRGIAQVYEAGAHGNGLASVPFFAMEYIANSETILRYAQRIKLNVRQRIELFIEVCGAVHHAHQQGVIHRDLKPANILVDPSGQPKVIDFGVARVTDRDTEQTTVRTDLGQLIGTMPYMSPEQIAGGGQAVDIRCDIYALGVIGYELLCGQLPYDLTEASIPQAARIIVDVSPKPLSTWDRGFRGDIETIFSKALHKDKTKRYQSAHDFAADVRRYLDREPIAAKPPSAVYQLRMFARRHRGLVAGSILAMFGLVVGLCVATWQAVEARNERDRAQIEARTSARITEFLQSILASANPKTGGQGILLRDVLDQAAKRVRLELADDPHVKAAVLTTIGDTYLTIGDPAEAAQQMHAAWRSYSDLYGELSKDALCALDNYLEALLVHGQFRKVIDLANEHVELISRSEEDALYRSLLMLRAARATNGLEGPAPAMPILEQAISILESPGSEAKDHLADALEILVDVQTHLGEFEDAEKTYQEILNIRLHRQGAHHIKTAWIKIYLGALISRLDQPERLSEAESHIRDGIAIIVNELGSDSHDESVALGYLAAAVKNAGRLGEAEQLYRRALSIRELRLGPDHFDVATGLYNLGRFLHARGQLPEATELLEESVAIHKKRLTPAHEDRRLSVESLAIAYCESGDHDSARLLLSQRLDALSSLHDDGVRVARVRRQLEYLCQPLTFACENQP